MWYATDDDQRETDHFIQVGTRDPIRTHLNLLYFALSLMYYLLYLLHALTTMYSDFTWPRSMPRGTVQVQAIRANASV